MSWRRGGLEGLWFWARALDDLETCPLRAYYSLSQAKGSVPYVRGGFEFQKKVITELKALGFAEVYADPGVRGLRTSSEGLTICASFREIKLCGRPDFVGLSIEPLSAWIVEVVQTSDWRSTLKRSIYRLNFYAQGTFELFGLPVSVSLFTPNEIVWVMFERLRWAKALEEKLKDLKALLDFENARRKARAVKGRPCQSCAYRRICPLSKG